jgi:glycerol-3-phosphate acyltransferase PlsY
MQIIINIILSYLLGSISGSMILGKIKGVDIRTMGSGNAGGTNAFRSIGPLFALGVVMIDIAKGIISVLFISSLTFYSYISTDFYGTIQVLCGVAAVIGHVYPLYYNFKGGKGAGTLIGVVGVLFPESIVYALCSWILILIITGFVGLGTIIASIVLVLVTYFLYPEGLSSPFGILSILMTLFIIFTHRSNIQRMLNGKENQFKKVMLFKNIFRN